MCNFAAQLKHVAYREELVEIQRDNTFRRETLKSSKKARYKSKWQSDNYQAFTRLSMLRGKENIHQNQFLASPQASGRTGGSTHKRAHCPHGLCAADVRVVSQCPKDVYRRQHRRLPQRLSGTDALDAVGRAGIPRQHPGQPEPHRLRPHQPLDP